MSIESIERVIVDTDPGIDDALAILLLAASPEISLEAITVTHGNTTVAKCASNALQLVELAGLTHVPVAIGASTPLVRELGIAEETHGDGGMGYAVLPASTTQLHPKHAVDLIIELIHKYPNEITLLCIGPMTNLALAMRRDPSIIPLVKRVVSMAGTVHYPGNATPSSEYNVFCDPHAYDIVVRAGFDLTVVPLDVTYQCLFQKKHIARMTSARPEIFDFIDDSTRFYMEFHDEYQNIDGCAINDPLAAAFLIRPDLVELVDYHMTVELSGKHAKAKTSVDHFKAMGFEPNTKVAMKVNVDAFMDFFIERINTL
jgi:purine nucleosidase